MKGKALRKDCGGRNEKGLWRKGRDIAGESASRGEYWSKCTVGTAVFWFFCSLSRLFFYVKVDMRMIAEEMQDREIPFRLTPEAWNCRQNACLLQSFNEESKGRC